MKELMIHLGEQKPSKQIEIEKLKQKFLQPIDSPDRAFRKAINTHLFEKPVYSREMESKYEVMKKKKPIWRRMLIPKRRLQIRKSFIRKPGMGKPIMEKSMVGKPQRKVSPKTPSIRLKALTEIRPEIRERPKGFMLGKLELLLKDVSIQSIECPGPGKNILVKKHSKINVTRIVLGQTEVKNIINDFSEKARIPIVGGILKAAVGDLVISAVISEFVGSRFIINRITPYSLIEK